VRKAEAKAKRGEAEAVKLARLDHLSRHESPSATFTLPA
jgi:hypothetical protein